METVTRNDICVSFCFSFFLRLSLFNRDEFEVIEHDSDPFAPVSYISFKKMHLEDKINVGETFVASCYIFLGGLTDTHAVSVNQSFQCFHTYVEKITD